MVKDWFAKVEKKPTEERTIEDIESEHIEKMYGFMQRGGNKK